MHRLDKKNIEDILPLTAMQEGMLFYYLKDPQKNTYFEQLSLGISGEINEEIFEKSWNFVIGSNEILRAVFRWEETENPVQVILKEHKLQPQYFDLSDQEVNEAGNCLEELMVNDRKEKFDLQKVPFRVTLFRIDETKYQMVISNHHILYDGWSTGIILNEFFNTYHDLCQRNSTSQRVKSKFKGFVKWYHQRDKDKEKKFWKNYLQGFDTQSMLPIKQERRDESVTCKSRLCFETDTVHRLKIFIKQHKLTLAAFLYTAWGILLMRYTNSDDVIFGTTVSGRSAPVKGIEDVVGLFINTLPLRVYSRRDETTTDLLYRIDNNLRIREPYHHTSLVDIKECSEIDSNQELFDCIVVIENYPLDRRWGEETGILSVRSYAMEEESHYDLTIGVMLHECENIEVDFSYKSGCFNKEAISRLLDHFSRIVREIIAEPEKEPFTVEMLEEEEKRRLLVEFNETKADYPKDKSIHQLFEEQTARTPDQIALVGKEEGEKGRRLEDKKENVLLTYKELNEKGNQLAHLLKERGVQPDTIVSILMERSIAMIIGIFGILKAGGAYLPLDPQYPEERLRYMLADSKVKGLVKNSNIISNLKNSQELFVLNFEHLNFEFVSTFEIGISDLDASSLAYIIYTSGSTGKPKGVMIEHRALVNRLNWMQRFYPIDQKDVILQKTPIVFDVSVWELFWWSISGASLCLLGPGEEKDPEAIVEAVVRNKITTIHFVPSMLNAFLDYLEESVPIESSLSTGYHLARLPGLRRVFSSGEALLARQVSKFNRLLNQANKPQLINLYGPTEAAVDVSYFNCPPGEIPGDISIPIGRPIDNIRLYVVNKILGLQPVGVPGELYISGLGLARGYLNRPGLTAEKFLSIRYMSNKSYISKKIYKTGDLARWLQNGNIEFLGRIDHQVKIRGFRIELGEIENHLSNHNDIKEAVVTVKKDHSSENYLCGYFVSDKDIALSELKAYLSRKLPGYMVPSFFVRLEQLPLTRSGKVDRRALPEPGIQRLPLKNIDLQPRGDVEKVVAEAWRRVLKIDRVGLNDNFFDIGGNSLHIIRLSSKLKQVFRKDIPVVALFNYPTVSAQTRYLCGGEGEDNKVETPGSERRVSEAKAAWNTACMSIAVIGMAGRFPGAKNIEEFWDNLKNGKEVITFFTDEELEAWGVDSRLFKNPNYVRAKGVLEDMECFDANFFEYSPREAEMMDPQLRILHECVWEALENAGYSPDTCRDSIGLYVGSFSNFWWIRRLSGYINTHAEFLSIGSLNERDYLASRISYKLNLKGPAVTVQTACSTSLLAVDTACQALSAGKCRMTLAGGVALTFEDRGGYLYEEGMVRSPDGHCCPFDAKARGTIGGNGVGIVVLKPLTEALADRDRIRAVIKGFASNNDGSRKVGYAAPSVEGQVEVIRAALAAAALEAETITYIETHGTGTVLGDPVEIEALKKAFDTTKKQFCCLGAVKGNIGHLDTAAGVAGLIKTVLVLENREIPPAVNFDTPNPQIDFENSPFYINTKLVEWKNETSPLRAGVSSFGIGGTNAHVILEEAPRSVIGHSSLVIGENRREREYHLILLSARTPSALDKMTENLAEYFKKNLLNRGNRENPTNPGSILADAAYTLQVGRKVFRHRRMLVCSKINEAAAALSDPKLGKIRTFYGKDDKKPLVFMFSGLGSQYVNMGWELYQKEPIFREEMDRCFKILEPMMGYNIKGILYPDAVSNQRLPNDICRVDIAQAVIFIFEYALARLLMNWGIIPAAMIGYSFGEYTAGCISGVFSLKDALKLIAYRGKLLLEISAGAMLSVPLPQKELIPLLDKDLSIAVDNGSSCIVAGNKASVEAFEKEMKKQRLLCMLLPNTRALHSQMMDPILKEFKKEIKKISLNKPKIPYISNVTGKWLTGEEATDPGYWIRHMRETVQFAGGISQLAKMDNPIFVEIGPGRELTLLVRRLLEDNQEQRVIDMVRHRQRDISGIYFLLNAIGTLWLQGMEIDWNRFTEHKKRHRMPLPAYPFDKKRYWIAAGIKPEPLKEQEEEHRDEQQVSSFHPRPYLLGSYRAPSNHLEQKLADIWKDFFGIEQIGVRDDFFDLGGDSLTAITVIPGIRKQLGVEVPLLEFFNNPTIEKIAKYINGAEKKNYCSIASAEKKDYYPLSSAQKRMFIAHQIDEESVSYNITNVVVIIGHMNRGKFEEIFRKLIMAHESFRTSFEMVEDEPVQNIHTEIDFKLEYFEADEEESKGIIKNFRRSFDLSKAPLLKVGLIEIDEAKHIMVLDMYHIISDNVSLVILVKDFMSLYKGEGLTPQKIQYKDFSEWQNRSFESGQIKRQEEYWLNRFKDGIPVLNIPEDYPRPAVRSLDEGDLITFKLGKELNKRLYDLVKQTDTTLFIFLLAVYNIFLSRYSNKEDVVVASTITGRSHADLHNIMGMFVNILALRNYPEKHKTFGQFLEEVKENALKAYENQDYPFDELVRKLGLQGDTSKNPLCNTEFAMNNIDTPELEIPGLKLMPYPNEVRFAKFDLHFLVLETNETINIRLRYFTSLFKSSTIETMKKDYIKILEQVLENLEIKLKDIKISYHLLVVKSNSYQDEESDFIF